MKKSITLVLSIAIAVVVCAVTIGYVWYVSHRGTEGGRDITPAPGEENDWDAYVFEGDTKAPLVFDGQSGAYTGLEYAGQLMYMSRVISKDVGDTYYQPVLILRLSGCAASVFLDDELLYADAAIAGNKIGSLTVYGAKSPDESAFRMEYISLPEDYYGKTLTIAQCGASEYYEYTYPCGVEISSVENIQGTMVPIAVTGAFPMIAYLIVGLIVCALFVARVKQSGKGVELLFLAVYALLMSLLSTELVLYATGGTTGEVLTWYAGGIEMIPLFLYICLRMRRMKKPMIVFIAAYVIVCYLGHLGIMLSAFLHNYVTLACIVVVMLLWLDWKHERPGVSRAFKWAFIALLAAYAAIDVIYNVAGVESPLYFHTFEYGTLLYNIVTVSLLAVCVAHTVYEFFSAALEKNLRLEVLQAKDEMAAESYRNLSEYTHEVAVFRHDMKNHLLTLNSLLKNNDTPGARKYLDELMQSEAEVRAVAQSGNELVDTVLNSKIAIAENKSISVDAREIAVPRHLPVKDSELVSVLVNMLDNAIDATAGVSDASRRCIEVKIYLREQYLYIRVKNGINARPVKDGGKFASLKGRGHGYGMGIMERAAKRNGGFMRANNDGEYFTCELALRVYSGKQ